MTAKADLFIGKLLDKNNNDAHYHSEQLAKIGGEYVLNKMIELLQHKEPEVNYLAAKTLGAMEENAAAYDALLAAINDKANHNYSGGLAEALEGFDCSDKFVDMFKLYLFGGLKASAMAKSILDYEEFNITPRVIKKAEKHWSHYKNNTKHDEVFELTRLEIEEMLSELKSMFAEEE